ncbi:MAG: hypothetical protein ACOX8S_03845 [Christensenellales bacterium]|jgi:hypothetical protein
MKVFNKRNVLDALKVIGVMLVIVMLCFFIGTASLSGEGVFNWILFAAFLLVYFLSGFIDGSVRGEGECRQSERLENQTKRTGIPLDEDEIARKFSPKKGASVAFMAAIPGIVLFLLAVITADGNDILRAATRIYFTPYLKLFSAGAQLWQVLLIYFAGAVVYPALYFAGYMSGPRQHSKIKQIIKQNDEDYKKGIRRRRPKPKKRRRSFFG